MIRKTMFLTVILAVLTVIPVYGSGGESPSLAVNPHHFPALHLTAEQCPFTAERTHWHDGVLTLTGHPTFPDAYAIDEVPVRIRGRGNATWVSGPDKRPLRIRFGEAVHMMGSEYAARDWILLANHFDRSLLRNYAALTLAAQLGQGGRMDYLPALHHVHLYVNGEYMGVYLLTDERDINPGRIDIAWDADPAKSGFFLEMDGRAHEDGTYGVTYFEVNRRLYDIRFPGGQNRTPEHVAYAHDYIERVGLAIRERNWDEVITLIDLDSFVDFYIVQELFKNPDVRSLSVFMSISGEGDARRLRMGPVWDFDMAAGNNEVVQPMGNHPQDLCTAVCHDWYRGLLVMPAFFDAVRDRWNEIRETTIADTIHHIRATAMYYQADFERNFERHRIMGTDPWGTPPHVLEIMDFMGQVDFMIDWLETRVAWLDDFFNERLESNYPMHMMLYFHTRSASPLEIRLNGEPLDLAYPSILFNNRTMLELHDIVHFGVGVFYDPHSQDIVLMRDNTIVQHQAGRDYILVNGEPFALDTSSLVIDDFIYIPINPILRPFGITMRMQSNPRMVLIVDGHMVNG